MQIQEKARSTQIYPFIYFSVTQSPFVAGCLIAVGHHPEFQTAKMEGHCSIQQIFANFLKCNIPFSILSLHKTSSAKCVYLTQTLLGNEI